MVKITTGRRGEGVGGGESKDFGCFSTRLPNLPPPKTLLFSLPYPLSANFLHSLLYTLLVITLPLSITLWKPCDPPNNPRILPSQAINSNWSLSSLNNRTQTPSYYPNSSPLSLYQVPTIQQEFPLDDCSQDVFRHPLDSVIHPSNSWSQMWRLTFRLLQFL